MKNLKSLFVVIFALTMSSSTYAQSLQLQKISYGAFGVVGAGHTLEGEGASFGTAILDVSFLTKKTYHNIICDVAREQVGMINGFIYNKREDIYVLTGKYLSKPGGTLSLGWEHNFADPDADFSIYGYIGYDVNWADITNLSDHFPNFGFIVSGQLPAWNRKK